MKDDLSGEYNVAGENQVAGRLYDWRVVGHSGREPDFAERQQHTRGAEGHASARISRRTPQCCQQGPVDRGGMA